MLPLLDTLYKNAVIIKITQFLPSNLYKNQKHVKHLLKVELYFSA